MKQYIGTKIIEAEPAYRCMDGQGHITITDDPSEAFPNFPSVEDGYRVRYADGYVSWSPKDTFERAYLPLEVNTELRTSKPSISQEMVDNFILETWTQTAGEKTTIVRAMLRNGFELGLIDWPQEETALLNIFEPLWKESYDKGAGVSAKLYNLQAVQRPELISTAKLRGGVRVKGITETTQQSIARIVSAGLEHGDSRATIAKQIEQEMQTTASRARTIATQECNTSLLTGHYDMMRKAGAAWKTWHVANMSAARPSHKRLNGERVPIDAKFSNGLMRPCDPDCTDPAEVVNCHCFLTFDK